MTDTNHDPLQNDENDVDDKGDTVPDVILTEEQLSGTTITNHNAEQEQLQQEEEGSNNDEIINMQEEDNEDVVTGVEKEVDQRNDNENRDYIEEEGVSSRNTNDDDSIEEEEVNDLATQSIDEGKDKKRPMDDKDSVTSLTNLGGNIPTVKPKRARSAYFIFMDEKRPKVLADNPGSKVGVIAKEIGKLWSNLTVKEKEPYQKTAAIEKEEYKKVMDKLRRSGFLEVTNDSSKRKNSNQILELPLSKIKKICRLDPEVKGISKEAVSLITKAAEIFTFKFGEECFLMAKMQNRRTLLLEDVLDVTSMKEPFFFLREDMKDLKTELKNKYLVSKAAGGLDRTNEITSDINVNSITSYFSGAK